jgi:lactoylglutathione lyase
MRESDTELILLAEEGPLETNLLVDSVESACGGFEEAGGSVVEPPFDIPIGKRAVVRDP